MSSLSTVAWVAHDLGIAVGVGGSLFGRIALEPSVRKMSDREERGRVLTYAWRRFGTVQLGALAVVAGTWFAGRRALTGKEVGGSARGLGLAKDILVATSVVSAVGAAITGNSMAAQRQDESVPMDNEGDVASDAPAKARALGHVTDTFGLINLVSGAGVVAVTTLLAMAAGKSARWAAVSHLLP